MRALIDTCVMIDGFSDRAEFAEKAQQILLAVERGHIDGCVTAKSLTDIYYVCRREMHDTGATNRALSWALDNFIIFDTTSRDCRKAFAMGWKDYEDALMIATSMRCGVDCVITRNVRDFDDSLVPIYTPEQFVSKFLK